MFLTRIGFGTKAVITGDVTQIDLARGQKSGLDRGRRGSSPACAASRSRDFTSADVVRHPLVQKIIDAYERDASARRAARRPDGADGTRAPRARAHRRSPVGSTRPRARPRCRRAGVAAPVGRRAALERDCSRHGALRRRRAKGARSTRLYRGKDYATNVLAFVYDERIAADRRHRALRAGAAAGSAGAGQDRSPRTAPISSSTACCICKATITTAVRAARAMEARETAILAALGVADPYAARRAWRSRRRPMDETPDRDDRSRRCSSACRRSSRASPRTARSCSSSCTARSSASCSTPTRCR